MPRGAACGSALPVGPHSLLFRFYVLFPKSVYEPPVPVRERPDVLPGRVHVPLGGLAEQGPQVHRVRGNGSHLAF